MPAASGWSTGSIRPCPGFALFTFFLCHFRLLLPEPAARGYETSKLLNGIATEADVTTDLYVTSDPCFSTGFSRAPMSRAGCSCRRYQQEHFASNTFLPFLLRTPHPMLIVPHLGLPRALSKTLGAHDYGSPYARSGLKYPVLVHLRCGNMRHFSCPRMRYQASGVCASLALQGRPRASYMETASPIRDSAFAKSPDRPRSRSIWANHSRATGWRWR